MKKTSWGPGVSQNSQKFSDYGDIPEDKEEELGTMKNIKRYADANDDSDNIV
jgi:hypothetical protein